MRNIKLIIEYEGTNYNGWQSQKNGKGIEDEIKRGIKELTNEDVSLIGSGRTDAGVHAYGQVANFQTQSNIPTEKFSLAINSKLPKDIVIIESEEVDEDFHSRFSAKAKTYRYLIYNSKQASALLRKRAHHVYYEIDIDIMKKAADHFIGTHDFRGFMSTGSNVKTTIRTISNIDITQNDKLIQIDITGNGFLYNMVRIITGTLIDASIGKLEAGDIKGIIESCNRKKAGKTLPPWGLYLLKVYY